MRPLWHGLATLVPVYATFRTLAHFRAIDAAAARAGLTIRCGAESAAAASAAAWVIAASGIFMTGVPPALASIATAGLYGWLTYRGQSALDAFWQALPDRQIPKRTHGFEWIALGISGFTFVGVVNALLVMTGLSVPRSQ